MPMRIMLIIHTLVEFNEMNPNEVLDGYFH